MNTSKLIIMFISICMINVSFSINCGSYSCDIGCKDHGYQTGLCVNDECVCNGYYESTNPCDDGDKSDKCESLCKNDGYSTGFCLNYENQPYFCSCKN